MSRFEDKRPEPNEDSGEARAFNLMMFLDMKGPPDWIWKINLDTLHMYDGDTCAFAHVYGSYIAGESLHRDLTRDDLRRIGVGHCTAEEYAETEGALQQLIPQLRRADSYAKALC